MAYKTRNRSYEISDHNPAWKEMFDIESRKIKEIFGDVALRVEHIGSTSIPGLSAKPTIDMLVIVENASDVDQFNPQMESLGYKNMGAFIAEETRMFEKEVAGHRLFIIHVFEQRHPHTVDMIAVRDYLIAHPDEMRTYEELKKRLKKQFPDDYISYRQEKNKYMTDLNARALKWHSGQDN